MQIRWRRPLMHWAAALACALVSLVGNPGEKNGIGMLVSWAGAGGFCAFGIMGTLSIAVQAREMMLQKVGAVHASVVRLVIVTAGIVAVGLTTLELLHIPAAQLAIGGALTGVVLGIAGQQTLANAFAGLVLLYSRPFAIGDKIRVRSGPLGGETVGVVKEIALMYTIVHADNGPHYLPNSLVQGAAISPAPDGGELTQDPVYAHDDS
ncbi:hypothetical protein GCM10027589_44390 [Actinocorallia lasiicapitis]